MYRRMRRRYGPYMRAHFHSGGPRRRRRPLGHGELKFAVISLIAESPKHGYELIKAIEEITHGAYAPSPGAMYPTLELLLDQGWIRAEESDGKKVFHLTEEGEAALEDHAEEAQAVMDKLDALAGSGEASDAPDLRTALRRLNRTVYKRAACGDLDPEKYETVKAALIEAAEKIKKA